MHATIPKGIVGGFEFTDLSKKFERMAREAIDICLRVLKESNKSRLDSYSVRNSVLLISHITFRDCRVHIFSDNLSRNSCIQTVLSFFKYNLLAYTPPVNLSRQVKGKAKKQKRVLPGGERSDLSH